MGVAEAELLSFGFVVIASSIAAAPFSSSPPGVLTDSRPQAVSDTTMIIASIAAKTLFLRITDPVH